VALDLFTRRAGGACVTFEPCSATGSARAAALRLFGLGGGGLLVEVVLEATDGVLSAAAAAARLAEERVTLEDMRFYFCTGRRYRSF